MLWPLWLSAVVVVACACVVAWQTQKTRAAQDAIDTAVKAYRAAKDLPPQYTRVVTYEDNNDAYMRYIADMTDAPQWQFFICAMRDRWIAEITNAPADERAAMVGGLLYHEMLVANIYKLKRLYDHQTTEPTNGETL